MRFPYAAVLVPPAVLVFLLAAAEQVRQAVFYIPNWTRLEKTFLMASGLPIYYGKDSGPALNAMYGPVSAAAYLPAALASSPEAAVMAASVLAVCFFFLPALFLLLARDRGKSPYPALLFAGFGIHALMMYSLKDAAFHAHADAPALGLSAAAAMFLYFRKGDDTLSLLLSAAAAVFAVWTKLVALPVLAALPLYVLATEGRRPFFRYLFFIAAASACASLFFFAVFGFENLRFNLIEIPGRHPLKDGGYIPALAGFLNKLGREYLVLLPAAAAAAWGSWGGEKIPLRALLASRRWTLFLLLALAMLPLSFAGFVKIGGSRNAISYTNYFLLLAVFTAWAEALRREDRTATRRRALAVIYLAALTAGQAAYAFFNYFYPPVKINHAAAAYAYAKAHPGGSYFPTLVLVHYFAEHKFYHDPCALMDRDIAGLPLTPAHLAAHMPDRVDLIAFPEGNDFMGWLHRYDFTGPAADERLPGFWVYRKNA